MGTPRESKSIVSLHELDDESFSNALEQLSMGCGNPWNDEMQIMLENSHSHSIVKDLQFYIRSLSVQFKETKDKLALQQLSTMILSHLLIIKMKFYELELDVHLNSLIAGLLEDIFVIYCQVELCLLQITNDSTSHADSKQFHAQSKQMLSKLKNVFHWTDLNVVHCLLKWDFNDTSRACELLVKQIIEQVLFTTKLSNTDDMHLCGYYLLFCKYKKFILHEDHNQLQQNLLDRFNRDCKYLHGIQILQEIQCFNNSSNSLSQSQIVENYFKYIKHKEKEKRQELDAHATNTSCDDPTNTHLTSEGGRTYDCYDNEQDETWNDLDDDNDETGYESSKDERIITFVDTNDSFEMDNHSDCKQDEKTVYFIESADDVTAENSCDHNLEKYQTNEQINVEYHNSMIENTPTTICSEICPDSVPAMEIKNIVSKQELSKANVYFEDSVMNSEEVLADEHCLNCEVTQTQPSINLLKQLKTEDIKSQDIEEVQIKVFDKQTELIPYIVDLADIQAKNEEEVHIKESDGQTKLIPDTVDTGANDVIPSHQCDKANDCIQTNIISQLEEYLSIAKPQQIATSLVFEHTDELQSTKDIKTDNNEPLNLDMSDQSSLNTDCKPIALVKEQENIEHKMSPPQRGSENYPDTGNYLFEFGYETPPKDGTCESEFHIIPPAIHIESDLDNENGFLTPENEIVSNIIPMHYGNKCIDYSNVNAEDSILSLRQYHPAQVLYSASTSSSIPPMLTVTDDEQTLDLSTTARINTRPLLEDSSVDGLCQNMQLLQATRRKGTFQSNNGVNVKKYQCNAKMIERLIMPAGDEDNLIRRSRPSDCLISTLSKSRKQLMSSLDLDIERAFCDLVHAHNGGKSEKRTKHANRQSAKTCADPKLRMKPVVDLSPFRPALNQFLDLRSQRDPTRNGVRIAANEDDAILKVLCNDSYTDEEISLLVQAVKTGTETRLPFKKRRMAVPEAASSTTTSSPTTTTSTSAAEISYPATPMLSIAELATVQPSTSCQLLPLPLPSSLVAHSSGYEQSSSSTPVGMEISYNLNAYPYNFAPCAPPYLPLNEMPAQQSIPYCVDAFASKANMNSCRSYIRTDTIKP